MKLLSPKTPVQVSCRIVEKNDVFGTATVTNSPQSVSDAMRNHGALLLAQDWIERAAFAEASDAEPIDVSIRRTDHEIVIHWYVTGDIEHARYAMRQILAGVRRWEL